MTARQGLAAFVVLSVGIAVGYVLRDRAPHMAHLPASATPSPESARVPAPPRVATPEVVVERPTRRPPGSPRGPLTLKWDADVPAARIAGTIEQIRADLAAGRPADGYQLFHLLNTCASLGRNLETLRGNCRPDPASCQAQIDGTLRQMESCKSVPGEETARRFEHLDRAAAGGDPRAQVAFGDNLPDELRGEDNLFRHPEKLIEWKAKRLAYLEAASDRGVHDAFLKLAALNRDEAVGGGSGVAALGYYLAWMENEARGPATAQGRDFYSLGLSPQQVREGEALRDRILARCCRP